MKFRKTIVVAFVLLSCGDSEERLSDHKFHQLMENIAKGWSTQDTDLALSSFDEDAIYMEPPNIQYYRGHKQLRPYFDALDNKYKLQFHNLWFDEINQSGAAEYTFSYGEDTADVGIVVVELEKGKIKFWREYQRKGPTEFKDFLQIEGKIWQWHIGNYPALKDTITKN